MSILKTVRTYKRVRTVCALAERTGFEPSKAFKILHLRAINGLISRISIFAPIFPNFARYTCSPQNQISIYYPPHKHYSSKV